MYPPDSWLPHSKPPFHTLTYTCLQTRLAWLIELQRLDTLENRRMSLMPSSQQQRTAARTSSLTSAILVFMMHCYRQRDLFLSLPSSSSFALPLPLLSDQWLCLAFGRGRIQDPVWSLEFGQPKQQLGALLLPGLRLAVLLALAVLLCWLTLAATDPSQHAYLAS